MKTVLMQRCVRVPDFMYNSFGSPVSVCTKFADPVRAGPASSGSTALSV